VLSLYLFYKSKTKKNVV
uniref:Uncharacterized protein n=1 Tax=Macaca nemestrina TaxID=9545 RepID=A0A2K6DA54_MACNE